MGVLAAGQQAAMGKFLAFTRIQENPRRPGRRHLSQPRRDQRPRLARLLRAAPEYRIPDEHPAGQWLRAHPPADRRAHRRARDTSTRAIRPGTGRPIPALEARFQRVRAKLFGYVDDPRQVLTRYPESDRSIPARYARAYAWHQQRPSRPGAARRPTACSRSAPHDPYFLELKGQILLESGRPQEALASLREAVARAPDQPLIAALLGHALISTEDPANFEEAKRVLRVAVGRDNDNPFAWYQLGIVYDREGDQARAALATAERYNLHRPAAARSGQCRAGDDGHPGRHARLAARAGYRDGLAHRGRAQAAATDR